MSTKRLRMAWFLMVALGAALPAPAARRGRLVGKVVDPAGQPIAGVTVTTTCRDIAGFQEVATTDERGLFQVDFERLGVVYTYQIEKAGYLTLQVNQTWSALGTERHRFTLHPGGAPATTPADAELQVPASTPSLAIAAYNEGARALRAKDYALAARELEAAVGHDPELGPAWRALSLVRLEQKRYPEAALAAEKAVALGAADGPALRARFEAYRQLGDEAKLQQAREDLERAGRLQEEARRIHNEGVMASKAGSDEAAFASFQEAVRIDPSLQQAWRALAITGLKIGRAAEAAAAARKLLEADPGDEEAVRLRYNAALKLGDESEIADALASLAAVEPATARDNLFKLGVRAFEQDDAAAAKHRLQRVLDLDPDHARSHYYLGVLLVREGAKGQARTHLRRFLQLAPNDPDADTARGLLDFIGS